MRNFIASDRNNNLARRVLDRAVRLSRADRISRLFILLSSAGLVMVFVLTTAMVASASHRSPDQNMTLIFPVIIAAILSGLRVESVRCRTQYRKDATSLLCRFWPLTDLHDIAIPSHMGRTVVVLRHCDGSDAIFELAPNEAEQRLFEHAWTLANRPPVNVVAPPPFPNQLLFGIPGHDRKPKLIAVIGSDQPIPYQLWYHYGAPEAMRGSIKAALETEIRRVRRARRNRMSNIPFREQIDRDRCVDEGSPLRLLCWQPVSQNEP